MRTGLLYHGARLARYRYLIIGVLMLNCNYCRYQGKRAVRQTKSGCPFPMLLAPAAALGSIRERTDMGSHEISLGARPAHRRGRRGRPHSHYEPAEPAEACYIRHKEL